MEENNTYPPHHKRDAKDYMVTAVRADLAGLSLIPIAGGAAHDLFGVLVTPSYEKETPQNWFRVHCVYRHSRIY